MGDELTGFLVSTAEMSNLVSFLTVICGLAVMFVFLVRLIFQDMADGGGGGVTSVSQDAPQVSMVKVSNPFVLKFLPSQSTGSTVRISLGCSVSYYARVYWGVDINTFHHVIKAPWPWFRNAFLHGKLFGPSGCLEYGRVLQDRESHEEREEEIKRKGAKGELELGLAPRNRFPLVLVFVAKEERGAESPVTGMLAVIHMKDSVCHIPSQVLCTYLRSGDSVILLRPLYIGTEEEAESSDTESAAEELETEAPEERSKQPRCVVCQLDRVSRVSLPCRHAVTCAKCFVRCKNSCPMCRAHVSSYFLIGPENRKSSTSDKESPSGHPQSTSMLQWLRNLNRRLNLAMGLQEN